MLPWSERVPLLGIHPDAASRRDIARLASELMEANRRISALERANLTLSIAVENMVGAFEFNHNDVRLRRHPYPCNTRDWCVVSDAKRRLKEAKDALAALDAKEK